MTPHADVLYIHPHGHMNDLVVPAGALACMNAVQARKAGRFAFEVTDDEIRAARVVATDLHWALALTGLRPLLARVRRVNPGAAVVAGGITAGHWPGRVLESLGVDHVVAGDAEVAFAALVAALLEGRSPEGIPNAWTRGAPPPPRRRMTDAEFDATDCLTADWFPTYDRLSGWPVAAFPSGRTLPVARGCARRCPNCYGSFADTFGPGVLLRSPEGLARELDRADAMGLRNLRLVLGRLPPARLAALLEAATRTCRRGVVRTVGLLLCTPPRPADLLRLEEAFPAGVHVALVLPEDHVPRPSPAALAREDRGWIEAAEAARGRRGLALDAWTNAGTNPGDLARRLLALGAPNVRVSRAAVWDMLRPVGAGGPGLEEVEAAVAPLWTFYAARLLSPVLAASLAPFRFLDDLDLDEGLPPLPPGAAGDWAALARRRWDEVRLPVMPGLAFEALPRDAGDDAPLARDARGTRWRGRLGLAAPERLPPWDDAPGTPLCARIDDAGVVLSAPLDLSSRPDWLALLPLPPGGRTPDAAARASLAAEGAVVLDLRGLDLPPAGELRVSLRVLEAGVALLDPAGEPLATGRADLDFFRRVPFQRDVRPSGPPPPGSPPGG